MPTLEFECIIAAPMEEVWAFHEDIERGLKTLSPPKDQVEIESADMPARIGTTVVIRAKRLLDIPL